MPTASHAAPLAGLGLRCQSDARLASLCREGHERAFEEIVRRYRPQLVSYAGAIVPAHRAEDVVQEALTKAHWSLATSEGEMKLKPWLYTIVRNRALNDLRDEPCHQHLDEDFDGVPQPPEVAAQRAELASVLAGVKSLPAAQREALLRRELEGRSHQEIAVAIGATAGAVRGLIFRARTALREAAGVLIPLPVVRALLNVGPLTTEATGAGAGIGGAAAGLTAGGGGGLAIKAGATLLVAVLAVGSGVAIHDRGENHDASAATVAQHRHSPPGHARSSGTGTSAAGFHSGSRADGDGSGRGSNHGSSSSGPGSSERGSTSGNRSGPGGGDDGSEGHGGRGGEGSGSGRQGGGGPSGHEGSDETSGHSGSASSGHGGSGGTSGEDSGGGSGTSGSGDSGSGSGSGSGDDGGGSGGDGGGGSSHEGGAVPTLDAEPSP
ncbi:MAG: RNA polymerase sigma factor [Solirubrobacterales bacterium]